MADTTTQQKGTKRKRLPGLDTIVLRVKRQDGPDSAPYWEEYEVEDEGNMNVISCLMAVQRNPVTRDGRKTTAPVWDQACLEEVCGSCTMLVNGQVRQSCTALVSDYSQPIVLEPMRKFPVLRDLCVDRSRMFEGLKKVKAWVPIDGTHDLGPGPRVDPEVQQERYIYSTCMTCGCCLDACPQYTKDNDFIGASAIGQVLLFNRSALGEVISDERTEALMDEGGLHECGNAQNCVRVCPKEIPLTTAIGEMGREISAHWFKSLFKR